MHQILNLNNALAKTTEHHPMYIYRSPGNPYFRYGPEAGRCLVWRCSRIPLVSDRSPGSNLAILLTLRNTGIYLDFDNELPPILS
jgi:hypothetical protein